MVVDEEEYIAHYGVLRRSGRYPWGSGGDNGISTNDKIKNKRNKQFLDYVSDLRSQGLTEGQVAQGFGMTINQLRAAQSISSNQARQANIAMAQRLQDRGNSFTAIGRRMNVPESTVRSWLAPGAADKADVLTKTSNMLKENVNSKGIVDVGRGVENYLGVTRTRLDTAIEMIKEEGYTSFTFKAPQAIPGQGTNMKVIAPPGTTWAHVINNQDKIQQVVNFSDDGGRHYGGLHEPLLLNPDRVQVIHKEEGGDKADGMIYVRPGVKDVSIGGSKYAQVRVAVGKDHYLKGMAIYKDDLPPGVDVQFHTSKSNTGNKLDAMKKNSDEPGFIPGGQHPLLKSIRRQIVDEPGTPNERVTSAMNIVTEEGSWATWSRNLSSQMLSKQSPTLAKTQLDMTFERRQMQFDDIMKLTNATVRQKLLSDFADATDSAAVHVQAAALPRTGTHVILPVASMPKNQIYAPGYKNGERVVLIRHPHGGTFEIPELIVNNRHQEAKQLLGDSRDAVGIHHSVASWLSGADFDGDHVLVIPNTPTRIKHSKALDELKDFDPRRAYPGFPGMKPMKNTQQEMGEISNLITDMSIREASHAEIARAVKHSMVVIDAEKHNLNHRLSYNDNGIKQLKEKYQSGGASTLISRIGADQRVPQRRPRLRARGGPVDLSTGERVFEPTGSLKRSGAPRLEKVKRGALTSDARTLMSSRTGTPMERLYADHSNRLKALANKARLISVKTPPSKSSASAKKTYKTEVDSLSNKLSIAKRNAPLERQAQLIAASVMRAKRDANPNMDEATEKKLRYQALIEARRRTGADKQRIKISDSEWDAIQAGAISHSKLLEILKDADMETVRDHATPKNQVLMTSSKTTRAKAMLASGYTRAEVAQHLGVSTSTLDLAVKGG